MCGLKPCKKCAAKSRIGKRSNNMARRKFSVSRKGVMDSALEGATIYVGYAASKALVNNVPQLQSNPLFGMVAQLAVSIILSKGRNKMQQRIATGMAVGAAQGAVNALLPDLANQIGINGPWGSYLTPGVSGRVGAQKQSRPVIRVQ